MWTSVASAADEVTVPSSPLPIADPELVFQNVVLPSLTKYCVECHDPKDESDIVGFLRDASAETVSSRRSLWGSVAEQLVNRTMPPADADQPSETVRLETAAWIQRYLKQTACDQGQYAGVPVPRRLNREQYEYAIEDLTGVEFDFVQTFPSDGGGGEGFNNNGELLFLPPLLMERYLEVAKQIVDDVIDMPLLQRRYRAQDASAELIRLVEEAKDQRRNAKDHWMMPGRKANLSVIIYQEDDYEIVTQLRRRGDKTAKLQVTLDGKRFATARTNDQSEFSESKKTIRLTQGPHVLGWEVLDGSGPIRIELAKLSQRRSDRRERRIAATNLLLAPGVGLIDSDHHAAAKMILNAFARKAWRRSIESAESDRLVTLFDRGVQRGELFNQALKLPLQAILVSPHFLFATEKSHRGANAKQISGVELATKLSLFLWHSIPDEELLIAAEEGSLFKTASLKKQIARMLNDKRSKRFSEAFAGQWLGTKEVGRTKIPDTNFFRPAYTSELVVDLRRQVTETMHWMVTQDRPITDWIDSDYAMLNKRLAKHYDLKPVPKSDEVFEHVALKDSPRTSMLGLGAVHMLTSYSRRTSPVLRGGWVLETAFGVHLPSPPPDAGALPGGERESKGKTVRERLEQHRQNPTCAACHDLIDPIGFGLENFDVLGRWREKEGDQEIDAVGKLPSGETFDGPFELRKVLLARQDDFREQLCRKMLGYALGRSLVDADSCTITQIADSVKENGDRMVSLIEAIVTCQAFTHRDGVPAGN